jgi:arsenate reductase-like glutaredoxin family protein
MKDINTQLVLIFNSEKSGDQKAISYIQSIPGILLTTIDLATEKISEHELNALAERMHVGIEDLLDPAYDDHISVHTEGLKLMDRQSLLALMAEDTKLISTPIVLLGDEAFLLGKGEEGWRENLAFEMASRVFLPGENRKGSQFPIND